MKSGKTKELHVAHARAIELAEHYRSERVSTLHFLLALIEHPSSGLARCFSNTKYGLDDLGALVRQEVRQIETKPLDCPQRPRRQTSNVNENTIKPPTYHQEQRGGHRNTGNGKGRKIELSLSPDYRAALDGVIIEEDEALIDFDFQQHALCSISRTATSSAGKLLARHFPSLGKKIAKAASAELAAQEDFSLTEDDWVSWEGCPAGESVVLLIDPGKAKPEQIGELLAEISDLHRMIGGAGLEFRTTGIVYPEIS